MKKLLALFILLAVAVAACGQSKDKMDAAPLPPEPVAPVETEPAVVDLPPEPVAPVEKADVQENPADAFGGEKEVSFEGKVGNVKCSVADRTLTFTVANDGDKTWSLDQEAGFGVSDLVNAKVFINNYESNKQTPYYDPDTKEQLFGPEETYSDNCGGVSRLAPGERTTCMLRPVPLVSEDAFQNKNRIWVSVPNQDIAYVTFTCE